MILDFTIRRQEPEMWPDELTAELEAAIGERGEILGRDSAIYAVRVEIDGDLWDAAQEYDGIEADLRSYGPVEMPDRPLIDGMGDFKLGQQIVALAR